IEVGRDEAEIRSRELPFRRVAMRVAAYLELFDVRKLPHVHLRRQVPPNGLFERLAGLQVAAREGPGIGVRLSRPLPEQHLENVVTHLEDDRKGDVGRRSRLW